ncbi:glycoside hydrolase family 13 protein [Azotobacter vinelandii]|uniref:glycoside hydrolase family 13 protein n=1 Tax=Azotobacter vinelandii TaxID=354 RepID=UPI00266666BE|nr:glycoside hydrolase family 13 protein [Azotobacter vinelandii]WKN22281.1 glycoside hydrolase family 13 protein [Azotobacter vinelandii]
MFRRKFLATSLATAVALSLTSFHGNALAASPKTAAGDQDWARHSVIYQIYPRSFADGDGDGMGDLSGVVSRLDYLDRLGVDALWLSPFYKSPQADAGYDVADYRVVDPMFGSNADFERLLEEAHARGMKVIVDLVPNHTSDEHAWFQAALQSPPGSPERARYIFRDGRGENGELPPNNWPSVFGKAAWDRVPGEKQWYLHLFDSKQPDLNWDNPQVRAEFEQVLRYWLDRGVDGFRVDVAHGLVKETGLPDLPVEEGRENAGALVGPMWDQDGVHEIYRAWRRVLDDYPGKRIMVAEAWVTPRERLTHYVRPDEMHQAFNFDYLMTTWDAGAFKEVIDSSMALTATVGAPTTWVTSNHDTVRAPSRYGLKERGKHALPGNGIGPATAQPDEALGLRRARALAMLTLALPGSTYIYQGEELGLPEHTTMDGRYRQDPMFLRTKGEEVGRDGCRVPLPWKAEVPAFGFGPSDKTWLPQPASYARYAVDRQEGADDSTLNLYRKILELRQELALGSGRLQWADAGQDTLAFDNGDLRVLINMGEQTTTLPAGSQVLLSSEPLAAPDRLPANAAVWLKRT